MWIWTKVWRWFMNSQQPSHAPELTTVTCYRSFPAIVAHPRCAEEVSAEEFAQVEKLQIQDAPSIYPGHLKTVIWYIKSELQYIIQVQLEGRADVLQRSICTYTPTLGMDSFDGLLAEDIEAFVLHKFLGFPAERIAVFGDTDDISIELYLAAHGLEGLLSNPLVD